ncbi:nucleoside phosphorylase domain-containing protein, partial [Chaetomium tenue]
MNQARPQRPTTRHDFEIAVTCALDIEADAVSALFDRFWDDEGPPYGKAVGDPNAYSTSTIGCHNIVMAHMPGMGKINAARVASGFRTSFPNIKLAIVVGICGAVPFSPRGDQIVLGDVIISDGVVQYDFGRRLPEGFVPKEAVHDSLDKPSVEVRSLLHKLRVYRHRKELLGRMVKHMGDLGANPDVAAVYPGTTQDKLFEATYRHLADGESCEQCGCSGALVPRSRLKEQDGPQPVVHFGLIGSGDTVMKSGQDRDGIARKTGVIGFEMEGAGVWDTFPCLVIKGACDYADSHKTKVWQRYTAATAAACMKAFLSFWVSQSPN